MAGRRSSSMIDVATRSPRVTRKLLHRDLIRASNAHPHWVPPLSALIAAIHRIDGTFEDYDDARQHVTDWDYYRRIGRPRVAMVQLRCVAQILDVDELPEPKA